jgi:hypothetical protein
MNGKLWEHFLDILKKKRENIDKDATVEVN